MSSAGRESSRKLTAAEAAQLLGYSRPSIYRLISEGTIPSVKLGARILVPVGQLLRQLGHVELDDDREPAGVGA